MRRARMFSGGGRQALVIESDHGAECSLVLVGDAPASSGRDFGQQSTHVLLAESFP